MVFDGSTIICVRRNSHTVWLLQEEALAEGTEKQMLN